MATDSSAGSDININLTPVDPKPPTSSRQAKAAPKANGADAASAAPKASAANKKPNANAAAQKAAHEEQPAEAKTQRAGKAEATAAVGETKNTPEKKTTQARRAPAGDTISTIEELEELEKAGALGLMTLVPAWLISLLVHLVVILIIGLRYTEQHRETLRALVANVAENVEPVDVAEIEPTELPEPETTEIMTTSELASATDVLTPTQIDDAPAPSSFELPDVGLPTMSGDDLLKDLTVGTGGTGNGSLASRGGSDADKKAVGATDATEKAVAMALKWLAEHQYPDGSWSFDHTGGKCQGQCRDAGKLAEARFAATGLALLPFLGAGQTHKQGKYKQQVYQGLYWLGTNMAATPNGGDMTAGGGSMYGHGIATIALCEGYAMTQDKQFAAPAQAALNFIMHAQDPIGGGWRYRPRTPGDTSAVGWQVMALKSGYLGFLKVNPPVIKGAVKFLDSTQSGGGAFYGYTGPGKSPTLTAVGLLCRMYLGWEHDKPELATGVKYLASQGPNTGNMYYSYYATQVLHQYDGPDGDVWQAWNVKMRDSLVGSQETRKHEAGSWMFKGADHGYEVAGRLYCTAMAAMTLEIYYRYMPIYTQKSAEEEWMD